MSHCYRWGSKRLIKLLEVAHKKFRSRSVWFQSWCFPRPQSPLVWPPTDSIIGYHNWAEVKNLCANAGDVGSVLGLEDPLKEDWQPPPVSCLNNPMGRGAWQAIIHGVTESWTWPSSWAPTYSVRKVQRAGLQDWGFQKTQGPESLLSILPCFLLGMWETGCSHRKEGLQSTPANSSMSRGSCPAQMSNPFLDQELWVWCKYVNWENLAEIEGRVAV